MGRIGHNHTCALRVATRDVILTHHHQSGELTMSAGIGIESELGKTRQACESLLEIVVQFQGALCGGGILKRMQGGKTRHGGNLLVDLGIILHRAAAERIETGVDTEILLRQVGVMSHHIQLAHLGKFRGLTAEKIRRDRRHAVGLEPVGGTLISFASGTRYLEYKFVVYLHFLILQH